ncbi:hypothetical protein M422DRAFT_256575 [Sphaerobolus stellatus SS14]|uniref:Uncharacterized protein n=1 Tax=Sphaerobolus stellatus (strain SS14) TaxID=990650 RepID=A0A0C9VGP3_SPHS4|nr:hypothetical protein M422DRAFT_256575 [Sphaerobolus stellatus SS14]
MSSSGASDELSELLRVAGDDMIIAYQNKTFDTLQPRQAHNSTPAPSPAATSSPRSIKKKPSRKKTHVFTTKAEQLAMGKV